MSKIVILGAGVTGLTVAERLSKRFHNEIVVIEKDPQVGGLAATISHNGFSADLGSHRIHNDCLPEALEYIRDDLGVPLLRRKRKGRMYLDNRWLDYPPNGFNLLHALPFKKIIEFTRSYFENALTASRAVPRNYEEAITRLIGKRMYEYFYRDFPEKLWGLSPENISREGMSRRETFLSFKAVKKLFLGKARDFLYPRHGIGDIARRLEEETLAAGAQILKGAKIEKLILDDKGGVSKIMVMRADGSRSDIETSLVVSTIPIDSLHALIYGKGDFPEGLRWRGIRILYLHLREHPEFDNETFYFPKLETKIGRISFVNKFSPYLNPSLQGALLTLEISSAPGDSIWEMDEGELAKICVLELEKVGIYKKKPKVLARFSVSLEKAYPVYEIGWKEKFSGIYERLQTVGGLYPVGRNGLFLHSNLDHAIIQGLELAEHVLKGNDKAAWAAQVKEFLTFSARD